MIALLAIAVFLGAVAIDYADSRNTMAVSDRRGHAAARWSVTMYLIGVVGFFSVMRVAWWLCFFEAAGLYVGSILAVTPPKIGGSKSIGCGCRCGALRIGGHGNPI